MILPANKRKLAVNHDTHTVPCPQEAQHHNRLKIHLFWIPGKKLKRNHTLTLHLSRNKYRIEYLFVSAAATNLQYNCFALKLTFYVLWLKRNAHTHFVFSNNSKRTYMFCLSSAQKTGIRFGFFWSCHWRSRRVVWGFPHPCRVYPCLRVERPEFWC